jgi:hypothetical protein
MEEFTLQENLMNVSSVLKLLVFPKSFEDMKEIKLERNTMSFSTLSFSISLQLHKRTNNGEKLKNSMNV